jgi:hypothetical protein
MKMNRIENHATDRYSKRTGFQSEYDLDPDLLVKPGAFMVAHKRHYTGNVTHQRGGYNRTVTSMKRWETLRQNKAHHKAEMARRKAAEEAKIDRRPKKVKRAEWMAKKKAAKRGGR